MSNKLNIMMDLSRHCAAEAEKIAGLNNEELLALIGILIAIIAIVFVPNAIHQHLIQKSLEGAIKNAEAAAADAKKSSELAEESSKKVAEAVESEKKSLSDVQTATEKLQEQRELLSEMCDTLTFVSEQFRTAIGIGHFFDEQTLFSQENAADYKKRMNGEWTKFNNAVHISLAELRMISRDKKVRESAYRNLSQAEGDESSLRNSLRKMKMCAKAMERDASEEAKILQKFCRRLEERLDPDL